MSEACTIYDETITLTAENSDTEPDRISRLQRVLGYVCALGDAQRNHGVLRKVENLHDHKGTLTVKWKAQPTQEEKRYFFNAWESVIGDGADNVEHQLA